MARFGRDIVRQLTDPTMAQGMFELGRQIGGLPGERRKKKAEEQKKAALIDLENQLRQTAAAGAEAARTGQVDAIELQIKSINEQLKTEQDEEKRQRLTDTYKLLSQNLSTARDVEQAAKGRAREVDIAKAVRGGNLSSVDGNAVGITTARMRLAELLETETDAKRRSDIFSAMDNLDEQLKNVDQVKAQRNVDDLLKAEKLYKRLEAESESRANILANADPKSEEYLRAKNESAAMDGIKQRMDELKADPDTARAVKMQQNQQELDMLTRENQLLEAKEKQTIAILSSLDPESDQYAAEVEKAERNKLGGAVDKVEKARLEAKKAQLDYNKLNEEMNPRPLTEDQIAYAKKFELPLNEGSSRQEIVANWEMYKNLLKKVAESGTELALRDVKPLDDAGAKAAVTVALRNLEKQGDLPFSRTFFGDDLADKLRELPEKDQEYLVALVTGKTPIEAEPKILEFVKDKFPKQFSAMEDEKERQKAKEAERVELEERAKEVIELGLASNLEDAITYIENETNKRIASRAIARGNIN